MDLTYEVIMLKKKHKISKSEGGKRMPQKNNENQCARIEFLHVLK